MNPRRIPLEGQKFERVQVVTYLGGNYYLCRCDCGKQWNVQGVALRNGSVKSCGCYSRDRLKKLKKDGGQVTHGASVGKETPEYRVWAHVKSRCYNDKSTSYRNYGGRGIRVCDRWISSFENFLADMGPRPSLKYSIHRIDNDGDYTPDNCCWATRKQQNNATRQNRLLTYQGKTQTLTRWAEELNISCGMLRSRLHRNWTVAQALETPFGRKLQTLNYKGESCHRALLTEKEVYRIRELGKKITGRALAKLFSVSPCTISEILRRKTWSHLPER